ncbi:hypothetical protein ACFQV2_20695 [Actinokineospora soli]|uniref:Uncharacterized protein n=1 Tax=Actinokineospora soli TaxID=1048753 RepID=A0ABW2TQC7_9PSEU
MPGALNTRSTEESPLVSRTVIRSTPLAARGGPTTSGTTSHRRACADPMTRLRARLCTQPTLIGSPSAGMRSWL